MTRIYFTGLAFASLLLLSGCSGKPADSYRISGKVQGLLDGTDVVLTPLSHKNEKPVQTAAVRNGKFVFEGEAQETPLAVYLMVKDSYGAVTLVLDNSDIKVSGEVTVTDVNGMPYYDYSGVTVKGSAATDKFYSLMSPRNRFNEIYEANSLKYSPVYAALNEANKSGNKAAVDSITNSPLYMEARKVDSAFFADVDASFRQVVTENKDSFWGPLMMLALTSYMTPEQRPLYESLSQEAKDSRYGQMVKDEVIPPTLTGSLAPEFKLKDINGKEVSLKDICKSHKYVLVDFWASWCNPCRKEMPNLKKIYADYSGKGLEIVGISTDRNEDDWSAAVEKNGLNWIQVMDEGNIADLYKVSGIPSIFVVDSEGVIIAEKLHGEALASKVAELFKTE